MSYKNNKSIEHAFLIETFGIKKTPAIGLSYKQQKKLKDKDMKLDELISKNYFNLEYKAPIFYFHENDHYNRLMYPMLLDIDLRKLKDLSPYDIDYEKEKPKLQKNIEKYRKLLKKFDYKRNFFHDNNLSMAKWGLMGPILYFLHSIDQRNVVYNPSNTMCYIYTGFVQLFYSFSEDYMSIYSPKIITPDYLMKNKVADDDKRYILKANIENIHTAHAARKEIEAINTDSSIKNIEISLKKAFLTYKKKHNLQVSKSNYGWISNVQLLNKEIFLVTPEFLDILLMCLSYTGNIKKNAIKRLLLFTLYVNTAEYPLAANTVPEKSNKIKKKEKKLQIPKKTIERVKKTVKENNFEIDFEHAVSVLEKAIQNNDRTYFNDMEGSILFWFFLNIGLLNLTTFLDKGHFDWRNEKNSSYMMKNKEGILSLVVVLDNNKYYYKKEYKTRAAEIPDLKIDFSGFTEMGKDIFLKTYRNIGSLPIIRNETQIGAGPSFARNYFKVHGKLNDF